MSHAPQIRMISQADVIKHAFTDSTFESTLLKDYIIKAAQEKHIKPILTKDLYDEIISQIQTDAVTPLNQTVLDLVEPALAFFVKAESLADIFAQVTSKGIMLNDTEFSTSASSSQRAEVKSSTFSTAYTLSALITEFLNDEDNIDDYPLYEVDDRNVDNELEKLGDVVIETDLDIRRDINKNRRIR